MRLASKKDMDEVLHKVISESKESAQSLVYRVWLYEDGYKNCYIARTADTNELCYMQSVIQLEDDKTVKGRFSRGWFPKLKEGEALLEGAYTFEKYRGHRLFTSAIGDICETCKKKGFKRIITHIIRNNVSSLKAIEKVGFTQFEEVPEVRLLFSIKRKFSRVNR